ncbi:MAG: sulfatase-like hydrolase/transferase [Bacteroidales bacterium]
MKIRLIEKRQLNQQLLLLLRLGFVFVLMSFTRWLFYIFNLNSFQHLNTGGLLRIMFIGILYDACVIAYFNLPLILLTLTPFGFRYHPVYQGFLRILYVITNSILIIFNMVDVIFYRYIFKRTTTEISEFFFNPAENSSSLLLQFFIDFWYIVLISLFLIFLLFCFSRYFKSKSPAPVRKFGWYLRQTLWLLIFLFFTFIAMRGGFQLKPIKLMSAAKHTESRNVPLLINSPFSIIKTFGSKALKEVSYFNESELREVFSPVHNVTGISKENDSLSCKGYNVVLIIIESLGREYIGFYNNRQPSLTPFLDSLFSRSVVFDGFANGKRSIEALPSILAGIPSLMPADYPSSPYINNRLQGMGTLLKDEGYVTAFFHGGNNGTMGFDLFSAISGFDQYFGRNEFASEEFFDGNWGIYDEPFLLYTVQEINKMSQPFAAGIFTLSSHHPYKLPPQLQGKFTHAQNDMEATFCYVDHALKTFFKEAIRQPWFERTIFIITADHTPENTYLKTSPDFETVYAVPVVFYIPGKMAGYKKENAQHIDILPTVMALTGTEQPVFSFGRNLFDSEYPPYILNYMNETYKIIRNDTLIITSGESISEMYDLYNDPTMDLNLISSAGHASESLLNFARGVIQQYNNRMIHNQLYPLPEDIEWLLRNE